MLQAHAENQLPRASNNAARSHKAPGLKAAPPLAKPQNAKPRRPLGDISNRAKAEVPRVAATDKPGALKRAAELPPVERFDRASPEKPQSFDTSEINLARVVESVCAHRVALGNTGWQEAPSAPFVALESLSPKITPPPPPTPISFTRPSAEVSPSPLQKQPFEFDLSSLNLEFNLDLP